MVAPATDPRVRVLSPGESEVELRLAEVAVSAEGLEILARKARPRLIKVEGVPGWAASALKQELLARGGDAALSRDVYYLGKGLTAVLLVGTDQQLAGALAGIERHGEEAAGIADAVRAAISGTSLPARWLAGSNVIPLQAKEGRRVAVMGILNATPDSFFDGGRYFDAGAAVERGLAMAAEGADIVDVGGESTRPGSLPVDPSEEVRRVIPVIRELAAQVETPISIDSYKPEVVEAALEAGATIVNDITALEDTTVARLTADARAGVVLMHMQGRPVTMQENPVYADVVGEVAAFLVERAARAREVGIASEAIAIDPGIGFGKSVEQNLALLNAVPELALLSFPLLVGASRKAFIGSITGRETPERLAGSVASAAYAVLGGASIVRVHDVKATLDAVRVAASLSPR